MPRRLLSALSILSLGAALLAGCSSSPAVAQVEQYSPKRAVGIPKLASLARDTYVNGPISSKGGPFMTDRFGRTILLHGVNAVYKYAPYTLTVSPGQPNSLTTADARRIALLGFNVVRVGIIWAGIEPGTGGPNQPQICTPGPSKDPGMWNEQVAQTYLSQVAKVVDELGKYHIYSLLDMHQDVWSSLFGGEGAPPWATCTSGNPVVIYPGRWSKNYSNPAVDAAFNNFFANSVVGGLQQEYQRSWKAVATRFANEPWIVGYDPINEPLALARSDEDKRLYATGLSCLYAGSGGRALEIGGSRDPLPCRSTIPTTGLLTVLMRADPHHLVFPEVDNASYRSKTLFVSTGRDLSRTVYNFHDYCPERSGVTGNPTSLVACSNHELVHLIREEQYRPLYDNKEQPNGPAIMMTEFGATSDPELARDLTLDASTVGLSWTWWAWRYYDDPTGSSSEALINDQNQFSPVAPILSETHAVAEAGTLLATQFAQATGNFTLVYQANTEIKAPTTIWISPTTYTVGYCAYVSGGTITSKPGSPYLTVANASNGATVVIRVEPGRCVASL